MGLDFGNTCPDIDAGIDATKDLFRQEFQDFANWMMSNDIDDELVESKVEEFAEDVYDQFEDIFEGVRSTNEEMRKAADFQIDDLEWDLSAAEEEAKDQARAREDAENDLADAQQELRASELLREELESDINTLENEIARLS